MLTYDSTPQEHAMFMTAILLSQQYNMTVNGKQFAYRLEHSNGRDVIETLYRTCMAITENKIIGIVGPAYSSEARLLARLCNRAGFPVIGYSTTDPELSDRNAYQTFYRTIPSDIITAQALLKLFQKYDWNSTNIIYQDDNYGEGGLQAIKKAFTDEIKISQKIKYDLSTDHIDDLRSQLEESPSRIVIVWADENVTTKIIQLALEAGDILAPSFLWIFTALHSKMQLKDKQLIGMLLIRPVTPQIFNVSTNTTLLKDAIDIWKNYDNQSYPGDETKIDGYALYAFDSAWLLILGFQEFCQRNSNNCLSLVNTKHCFTTRLTNRDKLHQILKNISFLGVSGYVQFLENATDRLTRSGSHFIIDNLQPSKSNTNELYAEEVLKLNGSTSNLTRDSTTQWISTLNPIRWPAYSGAKQNHYASLKGSELRVKSFGGRGQTILLWLTSIYLVSLLTSSMTTYFIEKQKKPWIQSIEDLKMCGKLSCDRIGVVERSQHEEYVMQHLMNGNQMDYHRLKHQRECYAKLLNYHIDVAIADSSSAEYFTQTKQYCQLEVVGFPFGKTDFGIAVPKLWRYKQDLDNHIMKLKEEGEIDRLCSSESRRAHLSNNFNETIAHAIYSISVQDLKLFNEHAIEQNGVSTLHASGGISRVS
ncbi:unnamed protein product [Rotaria sp. Silwood1]|nr:unnamed protein product [Rotaria sp. Silwood1]CAF1425925.1 unnamed protein product [Rotaria sp. Silwood1]CAF3555795.1 unnamed protein product [Rotaria sp. Silwood1]CAF4704761.1 unnamed protein product [Rotaria sp. Silwood1]